MTPSDLRALCAILDLQVTRLVLGLFTTNGHKATLDESTAFKGACARADALLAVLEPSVGDKMTPTPAPCPECGEFQPNSECPVSGGEGFTVTKEHTLEAQVAALRNAAPAPCPAP